MSKKLVFGSPEWRAKYNPVKKSAKMKASAKKPMSKEIAAREGHGNQIGKRSAKPSVKKLANMTHTQKAKGSPKETRRFNATKFESAKRAVFGIPKPSN